MKNTGKTALFIRHHAKPGQRDDVQRNWEKYVKPRVITSPDHEFYYFCHDQQNPDVISVFQLYSTEDAMQKFLSGPWYPEYLEEIKQVVVGPPQISPATLVWTKADS